MRPQRRAKPNASSGEPDASSCELGDSSGPLDLDTAAVINPCCSTNDDNREFAKRRRVANSRTTDRDPGTTRSCAGHRHNFPV